MDRCQCQVSVEQLCNCNQLATKYRKISIDMNCSEMMMNERNMSTGKSDSITDMMLNAKLDLHSYSFASDDGDVNCNHASIISQLNELASKQCSSSYEQNYSSGLSSSNGNSIECDDINNNNNINNNSNNNNNDNIELLTNNEQNDFENEECIYEGDLDLQGARVYIEDGYDPIITIHN